MTATETEEKQNGASPSIAKGEGTYVVLRKLDPGDADNNISGWAELEHVEARNAEAAIRAVAAKHQGDDVTYVAVPGKSWKPRPVKRRERVQLILG